MTSFGTNSARRNDDAGFTLIELLVVVVVIPLIMGGIADAFIVSLRNNTANSNRISDSVNAQLAQDYFVRDVQSASYITTVTPTTTFSARTPQVCPGSGNLLVALYHPAIPVENVPALDVAYWLTAPGTKTAEVDRYSCNLNGTTYASTVSAVDSIGSQPPSSPLAAGQTQEAITTAVEIDPAQFVSAASSGWTPVAAFTTAQTFSGGTLTVGSTTGFANGAVTVMTTAGLSQLTGCSVASSTTFTGCSSPSGTVTNGSAVTQSNISSVEIAVSEPVSQYSYNLLGSPRAASPQAASSGANLPTLLTLGQSGINPTNGGGTANCPDGTTANICIGTANAPGGVVVDSGGIVFCNGGGVHSYIHFQNGKGTVGTTAPESSSSCNNVSVTGSVPPVPDPLQGNLPNNGCMPASITSTANPGTAPPAAGLSQDPPLINGGTTSVPGVYVATQPQGLLEPGIYIIENGIGSITGMAPDSGANTVYYAGDPKSGVLLFVPPPPNTYGGGQGCFNPSQTPVAITGNITGIVPLDPTQSAAYFNGDKALGQVPGSLSEGVWLWQDANNTNAVSLTGYTSPPPGGTNGGLLYAPGANYTPPSGGPGSLSTGSMIIAGTNGNGTHLSLCLNWTYTSSC